MKLICSKCGCMSVPLLIDVHDLSEKVVEQVRIVGTNAAKLQRVCVVEVVVVCIAPEKLLNRSFRMTDRFLCYLVGGIPEVQFLLRKPD